jgi:hypothetical protein
MSEWWTYTLGDFLLFSPRTYYRLFALYNAEIWPLQLVTLALGAVIPVLVVRAPAWSGRAVAAILAALWLFVAWAYMLERYDPINFAARYFAVGFALQAALLVWTGVVRDRLRFDLPSPLIPAQAGIQDQSHRAGNRQDWAPAFAGASGARWMGLALFIYALAIHPLIPPLTGRPLAQAEIFGLAPDPTAVATLGVLLAATRPCWHLLILPLAWCAISWLTLWTMESPEAPILAAAVSLTLAVAAWKGLKPRQNPPSAAR